MYWIWKWLGYKDEKKELIKLYQLEQARNYFAMETAKLKKEHGKGWSKTYAEVVKATETPIPKRSKRLSQKQKNQLKEYPTEGDFVKSLPKGIPYGERPCGRDCK